MSSGNHPFNPQTWPMRMEQCAACGDSMPAKWLDAKGWCESCLRDKQEQEECEDEQQD